MYANPYAWTDTLGDQHTLTTHCNQQETQQACQQRHDEAVAAALDVWPEAS